MTTVMVRISWLGILGGILFGCSSAPPSSQAELQLAQKQPERVTVQHILIAFQDSLPGKKITRSFTEARGLAFKLYNQAKGGKKFDLLVKKFTDDKYPGIYEMSNFGISAGWGGVHRKELVKGFGEATFKLKVGKVGLVSFDLKKSPYGFHILKRLK